MSTIISEERDIGQAASAPCLVSPWPPAEDFDAASPNSRFAGATTLYCFDMDLTLLRTYDKTKWEEVYGQPWPGVRPGWFGSPDSFFTTDRGPAMDAYFEAVQDPSAVILLHTGRWYTMQAQALGVLASYGATRFDVVGFCSKSRRALKQKVSRIRQLLTDVPTITKLVMYDDKLKNVETFRAMPVPRGVQVTVYDVGVRTAAPAAATTTAEAAAAPTTEP